MHSILSEIIKLRKGETPVIDYSNSNRHCLIALENNGTRTAYCFSVPIYNRKTRKIVDARFHKTSGGAFKANGSNAEITAEKAVYINNKDGSCKIELPGEAMFESGENVRYGIADVSPTLNGILIRATLAANQPYEITLSPSRPFMGVRANDRCFSLMKEEFKPFATASCMGAVDGAGRIIASCALNYQKNNDREYALTFTHSSPFGAALLFEINLHENKLFQDTTVESLHPEINNAFGGTAFIGNTVAYGEQWLYSRPDFSKIPELYDKQIQKAVLHIPSHGGSGTLSALELRARFCSFGSNWENRVQETKGLTDAFSSNGYQSLDVTNLITDGARFIKPSEGFILKPKAKACGFSAVSTGDSYFAPQILEANFR